VLLDRGADINHQDIDGRTPLIAASESGRLETVQWLASRGAAVSVRDRNGMDALAIAKKRGYEELARWLQAQ